MCFRKKILEHCYEWIIYQTRLESVLGSDEVILKESSKALELGQKKGIRTKRHKKIKLYSIQLNLWG